MIDVNKIIDWEEGNMDQEQEVAFFQELVNSGEAWTLQGMYGRRAMALIKAGLVIPLKGMTKREVR